MEKIIDKTTSILIYRTRTVAKETEYKLFGYNIIDVV